MRRTVHLLLTAEIDTKLFVTPRRWISAFDPPGPLRPIPHALDAELVHPDLALSARVLEATLRRLPIFVRTYRAFRTALPHGGHARAIQGRALFDRLVAFASVPGPSQARGWTTRSCSRVSSTRSRFLASCTA